MVLNPRFIRGLRCLAAVALPMALVVVSLRLSDTPRYRYSLETGSCFARITLEQDADIDFAAVGGSRMLTAFDPYLFEREYLASQGREVVAYNLARSWFGPDYAYPMLRDLLERRRVEHLILMASYQRGDVYNPVAYSIARNEDLLAAIDARPNARVEHLGRTLLMFLQRIRDVLLGRPAETAYPENVRSCYKGDRPIDPDALRREQLQLVTRGGFREIEFDIADPVQSYAVYYFRRIVELARAHGTRVTFVHLPLLAGAQWSDETARRFEEVIGAPVLRLPIELRVKLARSGFRDRMHLVGEGRLAFTPWLVEALSERPSE